MRPLRVLLAVAGASISPRCFFRRTPTSRRAREIRDGERVLFLGDTLLERENTYGYLEERLTEQFRDRHFTVRNLSWSGDTPRGIARAMFDASPASFQRLKEQIAAVKPTLVFLGYGMAASLQEMADLSGDITMNPDPVRYGREPMSAERFKKELGQLMDAIEEGAKAYAADASGPKGSDTQHPVSFVILSPIRHEDLSAMRPGLPAVSAHNKLLEAYSQVIADLARERGARFVSLEKLISCESASLSATDLPLTTNGIHLDENGYRAMADMVLPNILAGSWNGPDSGEIFRVFCGRRSFARISSSFTASARKTGPTFLVFASMSRVKTRWRFLSSTRSLPMRKRKSSG